MTTLFTIEMHRSLAGREEWILYWSFEDRAARDAKLGELAALMPSRRFRAAEDEAERVRRIWYPGSTKTVAQRAALGRARDKIGRRQTETALGEDQALPATAPAAVAA